MTWGSTCILHKTPCFAGPSKPTSASHRARMDPNAGVFGQAFSSSWVIGPDYSLLPSCPDEWALGNMSKRDNGALDCFIFSPLGKYWPMSLEPVRIIFLQIILISYLNLSCRGTDSMLHMTSIVFSSILKTLVLDDVINMPPYYQPQNIHMCSQK